MKKLIRFSIVFSLVTDSWLVVDQGKNTGRRKTTIICSIYLSTYIFTKKNLLEEFHVRITIGES